MPPLGESMKNPSSSCELIVLKAASAHVPMNLQEYVHNPLFTFDTAVSSYSLLSLFFLFIQSELKLHFENKT